VDAAREHIEADLHAEMRALRAELAELRRALPAPPAAQGKAGDA
jgi:voltage-gated sodium channel